MTQDSTAREGTTPDSRATDFRPVEGAAAERYSGGTLLVEAYAAIWLILMAWLVLLWRKQASLTSRLDGLEAALDRAAGAEDASKKAATKTE
jgi:hypothetical protein